MGIQLLIQCASEECRNGFVGCVISAIMALHTHERPLYDIPSLENNWNTKSAVINLMYHYFSTCIHIAPFWKTFSHYFTLFKEFALLGNNEKKWLNEMHVLAEFAALYLGLPSPVLYARISPQEPPKYQDIGSKFEAPNVHDMIELASLLICSTRVEGANDPPTLVRCGSLCV